jgi:hypothetical protein
VTRALGPLLTTGALALVSVVLVPTASPVRAEHEVYYRYIVLGYAKDAQGKPAISVSVELTRDKTGFSYVTETDDQGFFVIVARLGDESAGETLTLAVGPAKTRITARFDPANHADHRGTRVDCEGTTFVERTAWFRPTLAHFLGAAR